MCGERNMSLSPKINGHAAGIFGQNDHERSSSVIMKANTYELFMKTWTPQKTMKIVMSSKNVWG